MASPRELRGLVPVEVAAVLAIALAPLPVAPALWLVVAASLSRWARGRSWAEVARGPAWYAAVGAAAGAAALVLALVAGTPLVEALTSRGVEWSQFPIVRGSGARALAVAVVVAATAIATELALRGWIVERVLELGRGGPVLAIGVGAIAEALITPGDVAVRLGALVLGLALGWIYVAAGRSVVAPACARLAFALGAIALQALRLVG